MAATTTMLGPVERDASRRRTVGSSVSDFKRFGVRIPALLDLTPRYRPARCFGQKRDHRSHRRFLRDHRTALAAPLTGRDKAAPIWRCATLAKPRTDDPLKCRGRSEYEHSASRTSVAGSYREHPCPPRCRCFRSHDQGAYDRHTPPDLSTARKSRFIQSRNRGRPSISNASVARPTWTGRRVRSSRRPAGAGYEGDADAAALRDC